MDPMKHIFIVSLKLKNEKFQEEIAFVGTAEKF